MKIMKYSRLGSKSLKMSPPPGVLQHVEAGASLWIRAGLRFEAAAKKAASSAGVAPKAKPAAKTLVAAKPKAAQAPKLTSLEDKRKFVQMWEMKIDDKDCEAEGNLFLALLLCRFKPSPTRKPRRSQKCCLEVLPRTWRPFSRSCKQMRPTSK